MATRAVHVYIARSNAPTLVLPMRCTSAGIYFEAAEPIKLSSSASPESIGEAFRQAFDSFAHEDRDLRKLKASDSPSFRASGLGTVKAFEAEYICFACYGVNEANALVRASTSHPTCAAVEVSVTFNPFSKSSLVGEQLLHLYKAANDA